MMPPKINPKLTLLPASQQQNILGLLQNPLFNAGMGLLSAGRDDRINPYGAALQGMQQAQQFKWLDEKRREQSRLDAERAKRLAAATGLLDARRSAGGQFADMLQAGAGQEKTRMLGPDNQVQEQWTGGRPLSPQEQLAVTLGRAGDLSGATSLYQTTQPTNAQRDWEFAQTLPPDERALFLGGGRPSTIKEWEFFSQLSPEEQERFLLMKRAPWDANLGGGGLGIVNPLTREVEEVVSPGDATEREATLAGEKAREGAIGKTRGEAQTKLGPYMIEAQETEDFINALKDHPGKAGALGKSGWFNPLFPVGTDRQDFLALLQTAQGKQFGVAYETLRGGGTITEVETEQATRALGNLTTAQSEEAFDAAADLFISAVKRGYRKLEAQAGVPPSALRPTDTSAAEAAFRDDEYNRMREELLGKK